MKRANYSLISAIVLCLVFVWSCGHKDPNPQLPDYLLYPSALADYGGSGRVTVEGALNLQASGVERIDAATQTYSGVLGNVSGQSADIQFTLGQPKPYSESPSVQNQYRANGTLSLIKTISPGTYQMGFRGAAGPLGQIGDLRLNLPGPQTYNAETGTLTISESTVLKTEGQYSLYRLVGTYQATMYADGIGITNRSPVLNGTFDVLLVAFRP